MILIITITKINDIPLWQRLRRWTSSLLSSSHLPGSCPDATSAPLSGTPSPPPASSLIWYTRNQYHICYIIQHFDIIWGILLKMTWQNVPWPDRPLKKREEKMIMFWFCHCSILLLICFIRLPIELCQLFWWSQLKYFPYNYAIHKQYQSLKYFV